MCYSKGKQRGLRHALWATLVLAPILYACTDGTSVKRVTSEEMPQPPAGAIKVAEDLYMVESGEDEFGCLQYSEWAVRRAVVAAVYYRKEDGGFTPFRSKAGCIK